MPAQALTAHIHERISKIEGDCWDALVPADVISLRVSFLQAVEEADLPGMRPFYLSVYDESRLVGIALAWVQTLELALILKMVNRSIGERMERWLGRRVTRSRVKVVGCSPPVLLLCDGPGFFVHPEYKDQESVCGVICNAVDSLAQKEKALLTLYAVFDKKDLSRYGSYFSGRGMIPISHLPRAVIRNRWQGYAGYKQSLKSKYRRRLEAIESHASANGIHLLTQHCFGPFYDQVYSLYRNVSDRAEWQVGELSPAFFRQADRHLSDNLHATLMLKDNRLIGFSSLFERPGKVIGFCLGTDYGLNREENVLLTMMHSIIQHGLEAGKDVDLQQSTYDMKGQFGAELEPTWIMAGSSHSLTRALLRWTIPRIVTNKLIDYRSYHVYKAASGEN
jgi:predicted N-acyltransferase